MSRMLEFGLLAALIIGERTLAHASVKCGTPSACTNVAVVADVRAAVAAACPCSAATSGSEYTKCWRPVVADSAH